MPVVTAWDLKMRISSTRTSGVDFPETVELQCTKCGHRDCYEIRKMVCWPECRLVCCLTQRQPDPPAVHAEGEVCISILHPPGEDKYGYEKASERWLPIHTVETIMISVISMLSDPNDESPANLDAAVGAGFYFALPLFGEGAKRIVFHYFGQCFLSRVCACCMQAAYSVVWDGVPCWRCVFSLVCHLCVSGSGVFWCVRC